MKYIPTGNEYVTLDKIAEDNASIEAFTVLHMGYKGMLEVQGGKEKALLRPLLICNGEEKEIAHPKWKRIQCWIPTFTQEDADIVVSGTILAPSQDRGFCYRITVKNKSGREMEIELGAEGCIGGLAHIMNESRTMTVRREIRESNWNHSVLFSFADTTDVLSFAPIFGEKDTGDVHVESWYNAREEIEYRFHRKQNLKAGEEAEFLSIWGCGYEEVSAATSAKDILRHGFERELYKTTQTLAAMRRNRDNPETTAEKSGRIKELSDLNAFFCYYYATGRTIDTEEAVMVTSRSTRYYVSAAFWDRDALLWAFPCILGMDRIYAGELLQYVFTRQKRNIGMHSRYIDGTLLEPGFELDELCAPLYALVKYCEATGDFRIPTCRVYEEGITFILNRLAEFRHPQKELYGTFLLPSDDEAEYPYVTYDNVLLCITLEKLAGLMENAGRREMALALKKKAIGIREEVQKSCVVTYQGRKVYAWSVDLNGNYRIYDEPPGSLQLLAYYGFVEKEDSVYQNTMDLIRGKRYPYSFQGHLIDETGCAHAPHPWILSLANSLLCGNRSHALGLLDKMQMDNGIACESVDEDTGLCATGEAFATCAGFLAYAIN